MIVGSGPIFATVDVEASIRFYKEVLGFNSSWTWGTPVTFGCASFGSTSIMFSLQPDLAAKVGGHQHWFKVEEVDDLYAMHLERGAKVVSPIEDRPWDVREYIVQDPSGYHLRFAGDIKTTASTSRPFPEGVRLERRKPTGEEHLRVCAAAFENDGSPSDALDRAWSGVVAVSPSGETIAVLRIMFEGIGWYSVWDVAVLPGWQGQRIGSAMMKEALEMIREASPGAFVFLFTFKHEFYERLGFAKESVSMLKV